MRKFSDWLVLFGFLLLLAGVIGVYRLPPKSAVTQPALTDTQIVELNAKLDRIEAQVKEIYEAQTTQIYQETLRGGY